VLRSLGGTGGEVDLSTLPPDIARAVRGRRDEDRLQALEKERRRREQEEEETILRDRERLRSRFDPNSEDSQGVDPLSLLSRVAPVLNSADVTLGQNAGGLRRGRRGRNPPGYPPPPPPRAPARGGPRRARAGRRRAAGGAGGGGGA
jgi:hypothetical protein